MVRRLVIMGSGETTPGMLGVHRRIFAGLPEPTRAVLLDSPFAFQENADELVERIGAYFADSVGHPLDRVVLPAEADDLTVEQALAGIRHAHWVFAGPGSPSYARRCWAGTPVPDALADVVAGPRSGALVLASAAAVTLGDWALPVYEIYKVGEDPRWEPGIGLMRAVLGWRCAVVPHYDNQEGGTHDTRFCYVGGRRLAAIEAALPGFILGVDEHTALLLDLEAGVAEVAGRGTVTLRVAGVQEVIPTGSTLTIAELESRVARLGAPDAVGAGGRGWAGPPVVAGGAPGNQVGVGRRFDAGTPGDPSAGAGTDGAGSAGADADETGYVGAGGAYAACDPAGGPADDTDEPSSEALARTILAALPVAVPGARSALVTLVRRAEEASLAHSRDLAGRVVQALVDVRSQARAGGDWAASDRLRDLLADVGVEVRDAREGSTWSWR